MNYAANTRRWLPGDLVLHDADAKRAEMLMRVVGYQEDGRCVTVYAAANEMNAESRHKKPRRWVNDVSRLHDPGRFGVAASGPAEAADRAGEQAVRARFAALGEME
jgi:hypothetical protein